MTERESFIAAIAANPADDTPRLAFADWLEEDGDCSRAGFIRDQVRLAKLRPGTEEYRELYRRTGATLRANLPDWIQSACDAFGQPADWMSLRSRGSGLRIGLGELNPQAKSLNASGLAVGTFERGFLEDASVFAHSLKDGTPLERLLRENPITRLTLAFAIPKSPTSLFFARLEQIRKLTLAGNPSEETAGSIFEASIWKSLHYLSLAENRNGSVSRLGRSPFARQLRGLRLPFEFENLKALAAFPLDDSLMELGLYAPRNRERFVLSRTEILSQLSALPFRPTLKKLTLAGCFLQDAGLALFARGDVWIRLRSLALDRNRFGDPGWRDFVRGRRTPELRVLTASRNFITNDGVVRLADSPLVETLEYVDLRANRIEGQGAMALARHFADSPLKKLLLDGNPIRESDATAVRKVLGNRVDIGN